MFSFSKLHLHQQANEPLRDNFVSVGFQILTQEVNKVVGLFFCLLKKNGRDRT
jgi:hypothetical protein